MRVALLLLALAACTVPVPVGSAGGASSGDATVGAGSDDDAVASFVARLERARRDAGCAAPLAWDARVAAVAQAHADDMARRHYLAHENPDGQDPFDRLAAAGISYRAAAENIAQGPRDGDGVFRLWWNSPGHKANMLNCAYTRHGVAVREGYWAHELVGG